MSRGFEAHAEVVDPNELFGHGRKDRLLDRLVRAVRGGLNTQLLGERRAGKTSLLHCCRTRLLVEAPRVVPLYVNFRQEATLRGVENAHRLLVARIHAALQEHRPADVGDGVQLESVALRAGLSEAACFELLTHVPHGLSGQNGVFAEYIRALRRRGLTVVLLLDEYEHMVELTFNCTAGAFFTIRDLSTEPRPSGEPTGLTYVIAGRHHWKTMDAKIGSPEFNKTGDLLVVGPISHDDFGAMWERCTQTSTSEEQARLQASEITADRACELTGGWPAFGKIIGKSIAVHGTVSPEAAYGAIEPHLSIWWTGLPELEQRGLAELVCGRQLHDFPVRDLAARGLLMRDPEGEYLINGELWDRFVRDAARSKGRGDHGLDTLEDRVAEMGHEIRDIIARINRSHERIQAKKGAHLFEVRNDEGASHEVMWTLVRNRGEFERFARQAYITLYERTRDGRVTKNGHIKPTTLARLPPTMGSAPYPGANRFQQIVQRVGALRNEYVHDQHLSSYDPRGMPFDDVLAYYLDSVAEPRNSDFTTLQVLVLDELVTYFRQLEECIRDAASRGGGR